MDQKYIIALELSGTQVKGALAAAPAVHSSPLGIPVIEAVAHEDKTSCVQYGRVHNLIDAAKDTAYVLQKLENCPSIRQGKITGAYVGLAGRSLGSMRAWAELVLASEQEITPDILRRLVGEATKMVPGDKMALAVLPTRFILDSMPTMSPVGALGSKIKGEFTVVTCSPTNRRNIERVLVDRLRLPIKEFVVTPLAIADMVLGEEEKQLGCVLADIGAQTTTVAIYKDRVLQYLSTIPMGSANITSDIAAGLNHVKERAELVKINQANALPEPVNQADPDTNRLNCYVQARLGEIIANIAAQIEYAGYKPADLNAGVILTGRGAKLKNMAKAISAQTKLKARQASIPATVRVADHTIEPAEYASLIAIALAGAAHPDSEGCVEMPKAAAQETAPEPYDTFVCDTDGEGDEYLLQDSVIEAKNKLQAAQRKLEEERNAAKREREKKEEERRRKEKEKEKEKKNNKPSRPLGQRIKDAVSNIFLSNSEDDGEVDLDNE